jgi:hypothetical protein
MTSNVFDFDFVLDIVLFCSFGFISAVIDKIAN